jgi:ribosome biogenesis GTPase
MDTLRTFGWSEHFAAAFEPYRASGLVPGRVVLEHNHFLRVRTEAGELLAEVAGKLKHEAASRTELPAVGDWVAVRADPGGQRGSIQAVLARKSACSRKVAGDETLEQVVAANIDTIFLVSSLDHEFNPRRIERYVVVARRSGAEPVIILNKLDKAADLGARLEETRAVAPGVPVHAVCTRDGRGFDQLAPYLRPGETVALLGSSGVGKSSIINRLIGAEVLKTADVRTSDSRGRHTSVHRQMVVLPGGGLLIDTPGMRELQLFDMAGAVDETFADIEALGAGCRFRDCRHHHEPGCAVKRAVETGALDSARYEGFLKLQDEREAFVKRQDARALLDNKRQSKVLSRARLTDS